MWNVGCGVAGYRPSRNPLEPLLVASSGIARPHRGGRPDEQGTRLLEVRDPATIRQIGYYLPATARRTG